MSEKPKPTTEIVNVSKENEQERCGALLLDYYSTMDLTITPNRGRPFSLIEQKVEEITNNDDGDGPNFKDIQMWEISEYDKDDPDNWSLKIGHGSLVNREEYTISNNRIFYKKTYNLQEGIAMGRDIGTKDVLDNAENLMKGLLLHIKHDLYMRENLPRAQVRPEEDPVV